jgi:hypothetical protein
VDEALAISAEATDIIYALKACWTLLQSLVDEIEYQQRVWQGTLLAEPGAWVAVARAE